MSSAATFNYADLLGIVAATVPDRTAVVCGARRISYSDLHAQVESLARHLAARGLRRGQTLALHLRNSPEYLLGFFASCRLGVMPFNVNYRYVAGELAYLYENAAAVAAFVDSEFVDRLAALRGKLSLAIIVGARSDSAPLPATISSAVLARQVLEDHEIQRQPLDAARGDDQLIIYTGGTTGPPKGVVWSQQDLFFAALGGGGFFSRQGPIRSPQQLRERVLEAPPLVSFPVPPLMHGAALWAALCSLFVGHTVVLDEGRSFDAAHVLDLVQRERVNILTIVGDGMGQPLAQALADSPGRWDLRALAYVGSGGAVFSPAVQESLRRTLPHIRTASSLGSTESGTFGAGTAENQAGLMRFQARADIAVVCDGRRLAQPGETGVLARRGPMPLGYFGDPDATARTFINIDGERLALTGDFALLEADGSITVLGRGSTCINTGGEKVFPEEVEQALKSHPAVLDALVVGLPDPRWGERVAAVVALHAGFELGKEQLKEHCQSLLASYKSPREVKFVAAVQRTNTGKPDYDWAKKAFLLRT